MFGIEKIQDRNILRIYVATLFVGLAYGISISLTALQLDLRGFDKQSIGSLAAWFAAGLMIFSIPMTWRS